MKKTATLFLATVIMVISLAACSNTNDQQEGINGQPEDIYEDDGYVWGEVGDTLSTAWFDFNVTDAALYSEYNGSTPSDGCQFLVVKMWLNNTYNESVPMWWSDFDVEWDDPDSYELPVIMTVDGKELTEDEYSLRRARSANLVLVYEVAEEYDEFYLYFDEAFEDGTEGDVFAVHLIPEQG